MESNPRAIGLDRLLGPKNKRETNRPCDLVLAMIVSRIIAPASKLATAKALDPATAASSGCSDPKPATSPTGRAIWSWP